MSVFHEYAMPKIARFCLKIATHARYYDVHSVQQGSAYLYLNGFEGAPRDQHQTILGTALLHPTLAKALRSAMTLS